MFTAILVVYTTIVLLLVALMVISYYTIRKATQTIEEVKTKVLNL
jgi:CHASE3 domain sensor protein